VLNEIYNWEISSFHSQDKKALCSVEYKSVKKVVQEAMNLKTAEEIEEYIIEKILVKHPKAFLMGVMPLSCV
jgi:hypothetical protein